MLYYYYYIFVRCISVIYVYLYCCYFYFILLYYLVLYFHYIFMLYLFCHFIHFVIVDMIFCPVSEIHQREGNGFHYLVFVWVMWLISAPWIMMWKYWVTQQCPRVPSSWQDNLAVPDWVFKKSWDFPSSLRFRLIWSRRPPSWVSHGSM